MIKIHCTTNLDVYNESWPTELPAVPRVGDLVISNTKYRRGRLILRVVSVMWGSGRVEIELHDHMKRSVMDFHDAYTYMRDL